MLSIDSFLMGTVVVVKSYDELKRISRNVFDDGTIELTKHTCFIPEMKKFCGEYAFFWSEEKKENNDRIVKLRFVNKELDGSNYVFTDDMISVVSVDLFDKIKCDKLLEILQLERIIKNMKIYLAGKITSLDATDSLIWRVKSQRELRDKADCLFMHREDDFDNKELWHKCYFLMDKCDLLLVNFDYPNDAPFIGTSMEMSRAYMQHKPIIVFSSYDWVHNNESLQYHSTKILRTREEAIKYILENY